MDLRLNRTIDALALLLPPHTMRAVQVLGTNGKGSTSTFLAALGQAHGLRTGLYTSPHFVSPRERIRINGEMLPEETWLRLGNRIHMAAPTLTYFEFITILAICAFQEADVELAIMEAGLGGRHDATTALPVDMLCYTPIAMDHESVLGDTLAAIAADKAAAIRHGVQVITGPQHPLVLDILQRTAAQQGSPITCTTPDLPAHTRLRMHGAHQQANARLAMGVWQHLVQMPLTPQLARWDNLPTGPDCIRLALERAFIPGRLQYIPAQRGLPALFVDGGHNPHGLEALAAALYQHAAPPQAIIFSCLADKNIAEMLTPLRNIAGTAPIIIPTIADNPRASHSADLAKHIGAQALPVGSLTEALALLTTIVGQTTAPLQPLVQQPCLNHPAPSQPYALICGSLYLLGELFSLYPHLLESSPTTQEFA